MNNASCLSKTQTAKVSNRTTFHVLRVLPASVLDRPKIEVNRRGIALDGGDVYDDRLGHELGTNVNGPEISDGSTISRLPFWPRPGVALRAQFSVYGALAAFEPAAKLGVAAIVMLNVVLVFTASVMREPLSPRGGVLVRDIPQWALLTSVIAGGPHVVDRLTSTGRQWTTRGTQKLA